MNPRIREVVAQHLPSSGLVVAPGIDLALGPERRSNEPFDALAPRSHAAVVLLDDQLSRAGAHTEALVDSLGSALEPGGVLIATARNRLYADASGAALDGLRGYTAAELRSLVMHRGFAIEVLCAPGAAASLRGEDGFDLDLDRQPGLLDAAPRLLLIARAPRSPDERGRNFLDSRPRKIAAAATLCRDPDGRVLVVYDRFKRAWTIPGGVVDPDEDPAAAAVREAWEEAGVKVQADELLGVFVSPWPDRLVFVFASTPVEVVEHPTPLHPHEISDVAWLPLDEALDRVASSVAFKIRHCLDRPGFTWVQ